MEMDGMELRLRNSTMEVLEVYDIATKYLFHYIFMFMSFSVCIILCFLSFSLQ